jgi:2-(1,2-epoxy-1,2-dihydrophenyl)acetyl-CoA isomerase
MTTYLPIFETIRVEEDQHLWKIIFNRPQVYQAMNRLMKQEIREAIEWAEQRSSILAIILTAEGKAFCSGQDLQDRSAILENGQTPQLGKTIEEEWNPLVRTIRNSSKIIIAAINGVCAGAGFSVALACDLIYAKPQVKFVSGFALIGLCPDAGQSYHLVKALGRFQAMEFALGGKQFTSEDFSRCGLVNEVMEDFSSLYQRLNQQLPRLAPLSLKAIKQNFQIADEKGFEEMIEHERMTQHRLGKSHDFSEGVKAFIEKRSPTFTGH